LITKQEFFQTKRGNKSYIHFRRDNNLRGGINSPEWKKNQFMKEKDKSIQDDAEVEKDRIRSHIQKG